MVVRGGVQSIGVETGRGRQEVGRGKLMGGNIQIDMQPEGCLVVKSMHY